MKLQFQGASFIITAFIQDADATSTERLGFSCMETLIHGMNMTERTAKAGGKEAGLFDCVILGGPD